MAQGFRTLRLLENRCRIYRGRFGLACSVHIGEQTCGNINAAWNDETSQAYTVL